MAEWPAFDSQQEQEYPNLLQMGIKDSFSGGKVAGT
jgi:hypothetical protein